MVFSVYGPFNCRCNWVRTGYIFYSIVVKISQIQDITIPKKGVGIFTFFNRYLVVLRFLPRSWQLIQLSFLNELIF